MCNDIVRKTNNSSLSKEACFLNGQVSEIKNFTYQRKFCSFVTYVIYCLFALLTCFCRGSFYVIHVSSMRVAEIDGIVWNLCNDLL